MQSLWPDKKAGDRRTVADFDGGMVSSDAEALVVGETDKAIGLMGRFAACFGDSRSPLCTVSAQGVFFQPLRPWHWVAVNFLT
jgi:hypothetical protein